MREGLRHRGRVSKKVSKMAYWRRGTEVQIKSKFRPREGRGRPRLLRHGASAPVDVTLRYGWAEGAFHWPRSNVCQDERACTPTAPLFVGSFDYIRDEHRSSIEPICLFFVPVQFNNPHLVFTDFCVRSRISMYESQMLAWSYHAVQVWVYGAMKGLWRWDWDVCQHAPFVCSSLTSLHNDSVVFEDKMNIKGRKTHATPKHIPPR